MKRRYGHIKVPLQRVHIELTNVCDLNCVFCPKSTMKRPHGFMETALAKRIISELGGGGVCRKVTFHVMGEPTLHRDFFEVLEHADSEGVPVGLTTNGAGLGGRIGERLLEHDLHQIDVSLQTPDEATFALRKARSLSFDAYLKGILEFFASYSAKGRDTIFKFRFLNTRFPKRGMERRLGPIRVISSTRELRATFRHWAERIYEILGVGAEERRRAMDRINRLVAYKWNVVEIYPRVFFETYMLEDWGHAFDDGRVYNAWAGYCFGLRDHLSILYTGDVALCCVDYDGRTAVGNLKDSTLKEVLSSDEVHRIVRGFRRFQVVHPHCKRCLGSRTLLSWVFKPVVSVLALRLMRPYFYKQTSLLG